MSKRRCYIHIVKWEYQGVFSVPRQKAESSHRLLL